MLLSHLFAAALVAGASPAAGPDPAMRVSGGRLTLSAPAEAGALAARIAEESRRFCTAQVATVTPGDVGDRRVCERAMADAAVSALSREQWRAFVRGGGAAALRRAQR